MNYIAIDIGGSLIKAGIVTDEGVILEKMSVPTPKTDFDSLMEALTDIVEWARLISDIGGIALSQPCVTDAKTAEALSEGALIYIKNTNPAKVLGDKYGLPYSAENDGNCAALAEVWIGRAKDANNMALVVCGTGIGGAVVIDRKIIGGHRKFAGEFGMCITGFEPDGKPIVWSKNGSTTALINDYAQASSQDPNTLNGKIVFARADDGDEVAEACVAHYFKIFSYGLHNIQHIYDPELILIGGAISSRHDFVERIDRELDVLYTQLLGLMSRPKVAICACGADANLIGAVYHLLNVKYGCL